MKMMTRLEDRIRRIRRGLRARQPLHQRIDLVRRKLSAARRGGRPPQSAMDERRRVE